MKQQTRFRYKPGKVQSQIYLVHPNQLLAVNWGNLCQKSSSEYFNTNECLGTNRQTTDKVIAVNF